MHILEHEPRVGRAISANVIRQFYYSSSSYSALDATSYAVPSGDSHSHSGDDLGCYCLSWFAEFISFNLMSSSSIFILGCHSRVILIFILGCHSGFWILDSFVYLCQCSGSNIFCSYCLLVLQCHNPSRLRQKKGGWLSGCKIYVSLTSSACLLRLVESRQGGCDDRRRVLL